MTLKMRGIIALFVALLVVLAISPKLINNLYNSILGRILLIAVLIFFAMNNVTLGLLVALCLIIILHKYGVFVEGLDNMEQTIQTPGTIGDDNVVNPSGDKIKVVTNAVASAPKDGTKLSELKAKAQEKGVDKTDISESIKAKASNSIPVSKSDMGSSENVSPFSSGMLGSKTMTEGFSSNASMF